MSIGPVGNKKLKSPKGRTDGRETVPSNGSGGSV